MYTQQSLHDTLFLMLYGGVAILALVSGLYLWLRRSNAFLPDVTPPRALRRWTAAFFVMVALSHVWWYVLGVYWLTDDRIIRNITAVTLDHILLVPLVMAILLRMLQNHEYRLWPWFLTLVPILVSAAVGIARHDAFYGFDLPTYWQLAVMTIFVMYYIYVLIHYGRWLRENYADLEHKEIWQSCLVLGFIMITFGIYVGGLDWKAYETVIQICDLIIVCFVVWRVETISDLSNMESDSADMEEEESSEEETDTSFLEAAYERIGPMLQRRCIDTQLYLQHDLTLAQLAKAIGTNRYYLSQYFSSQGTTYNAYINTLRINHFVELYRDAIAHYSPFTVQQLANDSGYRSYSTFSVAFKQRMGQNVTAWTKKEEA
jgi:AraC-like DNA-binding protein